MSVTLTALDRRPHAGEQLAEFTADLDACPLAEAEPRQHIPRRLLHIGAALDVVVG